MYGGWMLTRLTVVFILQYMLVLNHWVIQLKLIRCQLYSTKNKITSKTNKKNNNKIKNKKQQQKKKKTNKKHKHLKAKPYATKQPMNH